MAQPVLPARPSAIAETAAAEPDALDARPAAQDAAGANHIGEHEDYKNGTQLKVKTKSRMCTRQYFLCQSTVVTVTVDGYIPESGGIFRTTDETGYKRYFFFERVSELMHKQAEIEARLVAVSSCCPALNEVQGSAFDKFRGMVHRVLENHWFENGILLVIFLNTISMIMQKEHELEPDAQFWDDLDYVFSTIFMIEMSLKWFGYGLVRRQNSTLSCFGCGQAAGGDTGTVMAKGGYFRDTWNWLDFVIVIEGSVSMVTSSSIESQEINLSMVRIIRTLRPLRAVTHLPELQVIVQAIINSVPYIIDTLVICSFFFLLFSIAAMEWWSGLFHNRCFIATLENVSSPIYNRSEIVEWCNNDSGECQRGILTLDEDVEYLCGYRECPSADHVCSEWSENPNGDITSFDNVFLAWLTIFQISTLEGWVEIMNFAQDVSHSLVWPFFIIVVIFGNFILINLLMAVIANQYGEAHDRAEEVAREDRHKHQDSKKARAKWKKCQKKMRQIEHAEEGKAKENYFTKVVQSSTFDGIMMALIMLNIVSMSVDHYDPVDGEPEALADVLHYIGVAFTVVFGLEMLVKIIGLGLCNYLSDSMNIVDAVIVTIAIVELILADVDAKGVMALRALRFVRLVKLARSMKSMRQLCSVLAKAWKSIFYAMMLLLLFILIFSVAGMQLFARKLCSVGVADGEVCSEEDVPRNNYDSFYWAFVSTFQVLAGENWPALQFNAIQNEGYAISVTYYVLWVLIGQFIVLNLFLAIVMAYFEDIDVMESELYDEWSLQPWKRQLLSDLWHHVDSDGDGKMNKIEFEVLEQELNDSLAKKALASGDAASFDADGVLRAARLELPFSMIDDDESGLIQFSEFESWYFDYSDPVRFEKHQEALERIVTQSCFQHFKSWLQGDCVDRRKNLLFIPNKGARSCCHQKCQSFVESKYFEAFILLVITLSSILLAMDSPTLDQDGGLHEFIKVVDVVFVVIFVLEAVLKMATYGFLLHKGAYLRDAWNVLDFVVVGASIVGNVTESKHSAAGRTFRLLRAMRPLRMVSHNAGIKIIVDSLAKSIVSLLNVGVVVIFAWLLFALIGVQYLKGTFYRCNDPAFPEGAYRYGDSVDGCTAEAPCCTSEYSFIDEHGGNATREWVRSDMNFDNVFEAMLALFVFATGEGWPDAMFEASDVVGINYNPKRNATAANAMFFVLNVAVFQFFVMELFVGAIFENFMILKNEAKEKQLKFGMTERQSQWYRAQQLLQTVGVPKQIRAPIFSALVAPGERSFCVRAVNAVIGCAHHLITEPPVVYPGDSASLLALEGRPTGHYYGSIFQAIVYTSIVLNTIVMASSHYGQADWWTEAVDGVNAVFTVVFCCEAALKIVGSGATVYFKDWWNKFDFLVTGGSLADLIASETDAGTSLFRAFRIARVTRLARAMPRLLKLLETLWNSVPALFNVGALLFLLFMIYAVLGVSLFGELPRGDVLVEHNNFERWDTAMLVLFRIATGEDWQVLMYASYACTYGAGGAIVYYLSFMFFSMFILLNMFVMIISANFDDMMEEDDEYQKNVELLRLFLCPTWADCDPLATRYILIEKVIPASASAKDRDLHDLLSLLAKRLEADDKESAEAAAQAGGGAEEEEARRGEEERRETCSAFAAQLTELCAHKQELAVRLGLSTMGHRAGGNVARNYVHFTEVLWGVFDLLTHAGDLDSDKLLSFLLKQKGAGRSFAGKPAGQRLAALYLCNAPPRQLPVARWEPGLADLAAIRDGGDEERDAFSDWVKANPASKALRYFRGLYAAEVLMERPDPFVEKYRQHRLLKRERIIAETRRRAETVSNGSKRAVLAALAESLPEEKGGRSLVVMSARP